MEEVYIAGGLRSRLPSFEEVLSVLEQEYEPIPCDMKQI